jgi:hypothetical protein
VEQVKQRVEQRFAQLAARQMQSTTRQQRGEVVLAAAGQPDDTVVGKLEGDASWDQHPSWEKCRSTALPENARDGSPCIQQYFIELLKVQPCSDANSGAQLQISDTHAGSKQEMAISMQQAFGGRPDAVVYPVGLQPVPTNVIAIIELKKTGSAHSHKGQIAETAPTLPMPARLPGDHLEASD